MDLSWDDVREALRLIDAAPLEELELEVRDFHLVVRKRVERPATMAPVAPLPATARPGGPQFELTSPSVGVFRRPVDDGGARAGRGTIAEPEAALAVIDVVGETHVVSAPARVRVLAVLVQDGQFVEYGQPLMVLEPVA